MLENRITVVIIESNEQELKDSVKCIGNVNEFLLLGSTTDINKGFELVHGQMPQLIIINVALNDMNGIDFVETLRNRNSSAEVIFMANDIQKAFDSLVLEPFDYIVKPLEEEFLRGCISRLKVRFKKKELIRKMEMFTKSQSVNDQRVFFQKKGVVNLPLDEIVYGKAEKTNTNLTLCNGEEIGIRPGINETFELINSNDFIRTSRSYFINRNYLRKIDRRNFKCILYQNELTWEVPISKNSINLFENINVTPMY